MIAFICEDTSIYERILEGYRVEAAIFQKTIVFVYAGGQWHLKLPRSILYQKKSMIEDGSKIILLDENSGKICTIDFYMDPNEHYKKYETSGIVTIGDSWEDDILFSEMIRIDCLHHSIETSSAHISLNGKGIFRQGYLIGDVLLGRNLKIVLGPDFIMIRDGPLIQHLHRKLDRPDLQRIPSQKWTQRPKTRLTELPVKWELKDPGPQVCLAQGSLTGMILPSAMMLSSTFLIGLFTAYRFYENGREIADVLPTVLMPGMMLLSTVCSHPIARYLQKRHCRKEMKKRNQAYALYLKEETRKIHALQTEYYYSVQQHHISTKRLLFLLEHHIEPPSGKEILLGMTQRPLQMELTAHFERANENDLNKMMEEMKQKISREIWEPLFLKEDATVRVEGAEKEQCFVSLLIQAAFYCHDTILLTEKDFVDRHPFLLRLPGLSATNGRRIYFNGNDIPSEHNGWIFQSRWMLKTSKSIFLSEEIKGEDMLIHADKDCWYRDSINSAAVFLRPNWHSIKFPIISLVCPLFQERLSPSFLDLYQVKEAKDLKIKERWNHNQEDRSRIADIGWNDHMEMIRIDLSEEKNGPHGLIAGTTGSGKSELILTMLLSLMVNYSPEELQIAFIDFKGGGASHVFEVLDRPIPHIVGSLSNLDSSSTDRVLYALKNECIRRQRIFQETGSRYHATIMNLNDYRTLQRKKSMLPGVADLLIVVDEFAELKAQSYEMLNQLISIARIGRSLGIHLILSTQKPAGVVNDQIWANSRFKICMKVAEKQDSMEILHDPSALDLHRAGEFILECDGRKKKGICGYSGFRRSLQPIQLDTILSDGSIDQSYSSYGEYAEPEILPVCREIISCWKGSPVHPLWLNANIHCTTEDLIQHAAIGIIDDYYHQSQGYCTFQFDNKSHWGILAPDQQERNRMLRLIELLIQNRSPEIMVYRTDQEDFNQDILSVLHSTNKHKIVIVPDTSRFYEKACIWNPHDLLEHSQDYELQFVFFLNQTSSMPYRDQSLLQNKLCLKNDSMEEMSTFLGTRVRKRCFETKALIVREHLLEVALAADENEESAE